MALRLVAPVDGPAKKTIAAPATGAAAVAAVANRARRAARRPRPRGLARARRRQAAELAEHNDRYQARRLLLRVRARRQRAAARRRRSPSASWPARVAALDALDDEPREPVLLNLAGVLFYELGAIVAAEALFRAAQRLDAQLPDVAQQPARVQAPPQGRASRRRRACRRRCCARCATSARAPSASRRRRSRPTGQTVSLCMIVKDEEAMLPRCLAAVADHVDELIVVDTGSTDRTVEIAEGFGATVLHHEWDGDFAAARNVGLDAATSDWLMYLDADEVLVEGEGERLRELLGHTWREGIFLVETNHVGELEDGVGVQHNALRLFKNRPEYRFTGPRPRAVRPRAAVASPSASSTRWSASSTSATSAPSATPRRSRAATWSCCSASWPRASTRRSCTSTSAPSAPPPATSPARWSTSSRAWTQLAERPAAPGDGLLPVAVARAWSRR